MQSGQLVRCSALMTSDPCWAISSISCLFPFCPSFSQFELLSCHSLSAKKHAQALGQQLLLSVLCLLPPLPLLLTWSPLLDPTALLSWDLGGAVFYGRACWEEEGTPLLSLFTWLSFQNLGCHPTPPHEKCPVMLSLGKARVLEKFVWVRATIGFLQDVGYSSMRLERSLKTYIELIERGNTASRFRVCDYTFLNKYRSITEISTSTHTFYCVCQKAFEVSIVTVSSLKFQLGEKMSPWCPLIRKGQVFGYQNQIQGSDGRV